MKIALSWSTGKDSAWTLQMLRGQHPGATAALLTTITEAFDRVAMHAVRRQLLEAQADAAGLPLYAVDLPWPCANDAYEARMAATVARLEADGFTHVAFGDLFLADVRRYREERLAGTRLTPMFPLWKTKPTADLAHEMIDGGLRACLTCVDPRVLPASLAGRPFDRQLLADLPAGVDPCGENYFIARRYFGTDAIVGRTFQRVDGSVHQVIGLAADSYYDDLRRGPDAIAYFPMKPPRWFTLYVRSGVDIGTIAQIARQEAAALGSGAHLIEAIALEGLVGRTVQRERLLAASGGMFAAVGLIIATIGVFGFLHYVVASRRREIGIRSALGATPGALTWLVLGQVLAPVTVGLVAGLVGAICGIKISRSLLFGVRTEDPTVLLGAMAILFAAAAVAAVLPVRRAAAVDPVTVFRT